MFTPADLEEISFERSVVGGYKMNEVEDFVNKISSEYVALYKENEDLKKKLKIVVDKVESYRNKESLISEALLSAQSERSVATVEATKIINDAKAEAEKIIAESTLEAEKRIVLARENADNEIARIDDEVSAQRKHLDAVKKEVSDFKQRIQDLYKNHLTNIMAIPSYEKPVEPTPVKEEAPAVVNVPDAVIAEAEPIDEISSVEAEAEAANEVVNEIFEDEQEEITPVQTALYDDLLPAGNDKKAEEIPYKSGLSDVFDFSDSGELDSPMSFVINKKKK